MASNRIKIPASYPSIPGVWEERYTVPHENYYLLRRNSFLAAVLYLWSSAWWTWSSETMVSDRLGGMSNRAVVRSFWVDVKASVEIGSGPDVGGRSAWWTAYSDGDGGGRFEWSWTARPFIVWKCGLQKRLCRTGGNDQRQLNVSYWHAVPRGAGLEAMLVTGSW